MADQSTIKRFGPKRFIGEALSVTAGVLLAFSVDAWWSRVQEAEVVEGLRGAARVEAMANRVQLERAEGPRCRGPGSSSVSHGLDSATA